MARALWKGHLTFGLVNVPVELHGAVEDKTRAFACCTRPIARPSKGSASAKPTANL